MIIHRVRQHYRVGVSHQSRAVERTSVIIHRVRQRYRVCVSHQSRAIHRACHVLGTKPGTYKLPGLSNDYPHGETALSRVSHHVHSHQEAEHL